MKVVGFNPKCNISMYVVQTAESEIVPKLVFVGCTLLTSGASGGANRDILQVSFLCCHEEYVIVSITARYNLE